jgi:hypothetical protein
MEAAHDIAELAEVLRSTSRRGQGRPYPAALRQRVLDAVDAHVAAGAEPTRLARSLGLPYRTIVRWRERRGSLFRPVIIDGAEEASAREVRIVVHGPAGLRVEGLDVPALAELLRRLS